LLAPKEKYRYENPDDHVVSCGIRVDGRAEHACSGCEFFEPGFHHRSGEGEEASQKGQEGRRPGERDYERRPCHPCGACEEVVIVSCQASAAGLGEVQPLS